MTAHDIRQQFIDFFKSKHHTFVPSSAVVPQDDPTLLFTNAGMNQFKDVFLAKGDRSYTRAVNSQKCIRVSGKHNDLEEVGHDTYHHTFFEMLGNWSFGDYYKKEAIQWAWELLTEVWKLPKDRLYATVFGGDKEDGLEADTEAEKIWKDATDIDASHVLRCSKEDNFWEMGASGPCGPCSEIHIDLTPDKSGAKLVNAGSPQVIEIWNLVFIQYNRDESGKLSLLPAKHVDTGAGFERLVAVLQDKTSNYDSDVFTPILDEIGKLSGQTYEKSDEKIAFRVIADHIRMLAFSIADGGLPSNEGRGYVMRRILRRAARYGRKLGMHDPFLHRLVPCVVEHMGGAFPELKDRADHIAKIIHAEEEQFNRTLDRGLEIFEKIKDELKKAGKKQISGNDVFRLYDTYGFPTDLTRVLADENGLTIDEKGFEKEMQQQRERARAAAKFESQQVETDAWTIVNEGPDSEFVGYDRLQQETRVSRYAEKDGQLLVRLQKTPFYAESGGQVGDKGIIRGKEFELKVLDTQKQGDAIVHICKAKGIVKPESGSLAAEVKESDRRRTVKNHTATHLLHAALRRVLGDHVHQAGSLVEPARLRFDFTHFEQVTPQQIEKLEKIVNDQVQVDNTLQIKVKSFDEAKAEGAMALFGEKYGDEVRTIKIADFSYELCGGTHVNSTGEIGFFTITEESSVASGVRRIEAVTGPVAVELAQKRRSALQQAARFLNGNEDNLQEKISALLAERKKLEKELSEARSAQISENLDDILSSAREIGGVSAISYVAEGMDTNQLKDLGDKIREKSENCVALLASKAANKLTFVCLVSDDLVKANRFQAGKIIKEVAAVAGGGGGGRPHMATAGAKDVDKLDEALKKFEELLRG